MRVTVIDIGRNLSFVIDGNCKEKPIKARLPAKNIEAISQLIFP